MRAETLLRNMLGLKDLIVTGFELTQKGLIIEVRPRKTRPRCGECGRPGPTREVREPRKWRHQDFGAARVWLRCSPRRVNCAHCQRVVTECVPWAEPGSWFTRAFEDHVACLAREMSQQAVRNLVRVNWETVGSIVRRVMTRLENISGADPLDGLVNIGIDELSYRKHHQYITVVTDHATGRTVWVGEGKSAETLDRFFDELGEKRTAALKNITIDMSSAFISAIKRRASKAQIVFDRFHVEQLAHRALDEVRRSEVRGVPKGDKKRTLKKARWPLLKSAWNMNTKDREKISEVQKKNKRLYRAYLMKEALHAALSEPGQLKAARRLQECIEWYRRSRQPPFVKLGRTLRRYFDDIMAYVTTGLSNGRAEGTNGKIRVITKRAYGFHHVQSLMALIGLCCSQIGQSLRPPVWAPLNSGAAV